MYRKILVTAITLCFAFALNVSTVFAGFGVTPGTIENQVIKPGSSYSKTIIITQSEPDADLEVVFEPDFGEYNDWLSFEPGIEFTIPAGENRFEAVVTISVPADADIADYDGYLRIKAAASEDVENGVAIVQGTRIDLNFTTTNEDLIDLLVRAITVSDTLEGGQVAVDLKVENKGNTVAGPTEVELDVKDLNQNLLTKLTATEIGTVEPGVTSTVQAVFDAAGLEPGEYFGEVRAYLSDSILREEEVVFVVTPASVPEAGAENQSSGDVNSVLQENSTAIVIFGVILLAVLVLGAPYIYLRSINDFTSSKSKIIIALSFMLYVLLSIALILVVNLDADTEDETEQVEEITDEVNEPSAFDVTTNTSITVLEPESTSQAQVLGVNTESANPEDVYSVFAQPNFDANKVSRVEPGQTFSVVEESGDWYKVVLDGGTEGWLHASSINSFERVDR